MNLREFFKKKPTSGTVANDRLKLLLYLERSGCSPEIMEKIKIDIYAVLQKYLDIGSEVEDFDLKVETTRVEGSDMDVPALVANIPIIGMKKVDRR